ncbi:MAG: hypothetical protein ACHQ6T_05745 [Myxococcota bacterium]
MTEGEGVPWLLIFILTGKLIGFLLAVWIFVALPVTTLASAIMARRSPEPAARERHLRRVRWTLALVLGKGRRPEQTLLYRWASREAGAKS